MSQEQYNNLLSSLLKEKHALAKLRVELEGRKGKLCKSCKGFGHLARNCRNRKEGEKGVEIPQNKFEVLRSRVMQCSVTEGVVRSMRVAVVKCFRCGDKGHKCRVCPKKEKRVACPREGKAHQGERREVRRVEGSEVARPEKGKVQQEEWKRSSWEERRKRAEWYCGPTVPQDAELWELGWRGQGSVVMYLKCPRCGTGGCYVEDDRGQGIVPYWRRKKMSWCGCKGKKKESGAPIERKSAVRVEKAARPRKAKAQ